MGGKPEALNDERVDGLDSPVGRQFQVHQLHGTARLAGSFLNEVRKLKAQLLAALAAKDGGAGLPS